MPAIFYSLIFAKQKRRKRIESIYETKDSKKKTRLEARINSNKERKGYPSFQSIGGLPSW